MNKHPAQMRPPIRLSLVIVAVALLLTLGAARVVLGVGAHESGDGVLATLTLEAVGTGVSTITIVDPKDISDENGNSVEPANEFGSFTGAVFAANIAVDQACQAPPSPDETQIAIGVDADPSGNTPTSLGTIDDCRQVNLNDTFDVDIFIQNVSNIAAFGITFSYDRSILNVVGHDSTTQMLAANEGSSVQFDLSDPVPDTDGFYLVGAVDTAPPSTSDQNTDTPDQDTDSDGDGTPDNEDAFPMDASEDTDTDSDGIGDNADPDDDNDGTPDNEDAFPLDASEDADNDGDGIGDNADPDDDNDGQTDVAEIAGGSDPLDDTSLSPNGGPDTGVGALAGDDEDDDGLAWPIIGAILAAAAAVVLAGLAYLRARARRTG